MGLHGCVPEVELTRDLGVREPSRQESELHGRQPNHDRPPIQPARRDGREHAIRLRDGYAEINAADVQALDVRSTSQLPIVAMQYNGNSA